MEQQEPKKYQYVITLKSTSQSHRTRDKMTEDELHKWIGTGAAGVLYSTGPMVRFYPNDIENIQRIGE
jgi:hypothetical protein